MTLTTALIIIYGIIMVLMVASGVVSLFWKVLSKDMKNTLTTAGIIIMVGVIIGLLIVLN